MNMTPTISLPLPNLLFDFLNVIRQSFTFAEKTDDDAFDDDDGDDAFDEDALDFGADDDDDSDEDDDSEDDDDDDSDDDDDDKKSKKKLTKTEKTAIIQKKRYRDRLTKAEEKLALIEKDKPEGNLSDEQKKEKAAEEFLANRIKSVLTAIQNEEKSTSAAAQEEFDEEMEEVLDENEHLTEKDILKITKELDVTPRKALKIIERERKLSKREKPKLPKEKRAGTTVAKKEDAVSDAKPTLDSIARRIKASLKQ